MATFFLVTLLFVRGIFLLQLACIHQDDLGNLGRGRSAVYLTGIPLLHQLGQQTAMIQMGVRQKHRINL